MAKILAFGGSGAQGAPTARRLLEAGHHVRLLARDPRKLAKLHALGAEVIAGDMTDPDSVRAASRDMDGMFLLVPFFGGTLEHAVVPIDCAAEAGIRRIVWNASGAVPSALTGNPGVDLRIAILERLQATGLDFVALQPTVYMENLLGPWTAPEVATRNTLAYPIPDTVKLQWISHEDAAAYSVAAFDQLPHGQHLIEICGPECLSGPQMAASFTAALGRTIAFRPMPPREFGKILDDAFGGGGDATAAFYEEVFRNPSLLSTDVDYRALRDRLTIRPTRMQDFALSHLATFSEQ